MRFSMHDMKRDHLELKAHDKWILDMCLLDAGRPILTTVCKGGAVKLWDFTNTRKLRLVEEVGILPVPLIFLQFNSMSSLSSF